MQLTVSSVRNLQQVSIHSNPLFNVIFGANGSGKTSLLESIYLLGYGRSFRTRQMDRLIQNNQDKLTVFAQYSAEFTSESSIPIGIERDSQGKCVIRVANETVKSSAELVRLFPVQLINPHSIQLLEGGPKQRREFIDWALFHVEHRFYALWKNHQTALKQRNAALKQQQTREQISAWDDILVNTAEQIDRMRRDMLATLIPICEQYCQDFAAIRDVEFEYDRGWAEEKPYRAALSESFFRDKQYGCTQLGPHRADLLIKINGMPVQDVLSRGEQKILVNSLILARGALLQQLQGKKAIFLIDDLPAELDVIHRQQLVDRLLQLNAQTFVSGIEKNDLIHLFPVEYVSMFHVEHGRVTEEVF